MGVAPGKHCNTSTDCVFFGADSGQSSLGTLANPETYGTACCNNTCQWMTYEGDKGANGPWVCPDASKGNLPMDHYCYIRMNQVPYKNEYNNYVKSSMPSERKKCKTPTDYKTLT